MSAVFMRCIEKQYNIPFQMPTVGASLSPSSYTEELVGIFVRSLDTLLEFGEEWTSVECSTVIPTARVGANVIWPFA